MADYVTSRSTSQTGDAEGGRGGGFSSGWQALAMRVGMSRCTVIKGELNGKIKKRKENAPNRE